MKRIGMAMVCMQSVLVFPQVQILEVAGKAIESQKEQQAQHPFEKQAAAVKEKFKKGPCYEGPGKNDIPLIKAICKGDLAAVKKEFGKVLQMQEVEKDDLKSGAGRWSCTFKDKKGRTLLHWAAFYGFLPIVEFLVQNDAEIDRADDEGWTSLHYAAVEGYADIVRYFVQKGADTKACTKEDKCVWGLPINREVWRALEGN